MTGQVQRCYFYPMIEEEAFGHGIRSDPSQYSGTQRQARGRSADLPYHRFLLGYVQLRMARRQMVENIVQFSR